MDSTRHLARSFSCSTISFLPASSSSAASEPGHDLSLGHGHGRIRGDSRALFAPAQVQVDARKANRNSSLTLRRMSTFARFLRKSTSSNSRGEDERGKLHKRSRKNSCVGPEWISSPRDYTSCTLCDKFFVSGEDWLEHYGQCVDEREHGVKIESAQDLTTGAVRSPNTPVSNALASASKAEEPYCEKCDRYFSTSSALYHHRSEAHPGSVPHDLCPICNVTCSLEEHLKHAVMHRAVPSPRSDAELGEIWPRCCFACDQTFDDIEAMKEHNRYLKRHNRIMHERQAETAADEWQTYCWPCDQYFASQVDLDQHHRSCTSPLKLMTYIEGELLTAARLKSDDDSLVEETLEATYLASLPFSRNTEEDRVRDQFLVQSPTSHSPNPLSSQPSLQVRTDRLINGSNGRRSREEHPSRRMSLAPIPSLSPLDLNPPEASLAPITQALQSPQRAGPLSSPEERRVPPVSPKPKIPPSPQSPHQGGPSSPSRERRAPPAIPPKPPKTSSPPSKPPAPNVKPSLPAKPARGPPPPPPPVPPRSASRPPSRLTTPASSPGNIHSPGVYASPATQSLQAILRGIPPPPPITPSTEARIRASIPLVFEPSVSQAAPTELRSPPPLTPTPSASQFPLMSMPLAARSEMNVQITCRDSSDEDDGTAHSHDQLPTQARSRLRVQSMIALKTLSPDPTSSSSSSSSSSLSDIEPKTKLKRMSMAALSVASAAYECPLCFEPEEALSNIPCGHVFCTACIEQLLKREPQCPLCRATAQPGDTRRVFLNT